MIDNWIWEDIEQKTGLRPHTSTSVTGTGNIERFRIDGHSAGSKNGAITVYPDSGYWFQDWKSSRGCSGHQSRLDYPESPLEKLVSDHERRALRKSLEKKRDLDYKLAAKSASSMYFSCSVAVSDHTYLLKKQITNHNSLMVSSGRYAGCLVYPVIRDSAIMSLQFIDSEGKKSFYPGGRVKGGYFLLGNFSDPDPIIAVEGVATGATLYKELKRPIFVYYSAGNVGPALHSIILDYGLLNSHKIIVAADNDSNGVGINSAMDCFCKYGFRNAEVRAPSSQVEGVNDWNDVAVKGGEKGRDFIHKSFSDL